ncbi:unnamed protein product [Cutaneotrichosporon oleaginosum]
MLTLDTPTRPPLTHPLQPQQTPPSLPPYGMEYSLARTRRPEVPGYETAGTGVERGARNQNMAQSPPHALVLDFSNASGVRLSVWARERVGA